MTPTKELFLKRKNLRDPLLAVVKQDWFHEALIYCQAETLSGSMVNADYVRGANAFMEHLLTLADDEQPLPPNVTSGIDHNIDRPRNQQPEQEKA